MTLVLMADQVVVDQDHTLVDREIHLLLLHLKVIMVVLVVERGVQGETLAVAEVELAAQVALVQALDNLEAQVGLVLKQIFQALL